MDVKSIPSPDNALQLECKTDLHDMENSFHCAGLIYGPDLHHLDHLAPICSLMNIPLIVTEKR